MVISGVNVTMESKKNLDAGAGYPHINNRCQHTNCNSDADAGMDAHRAVIKGLTRNSMNYMRVSKTVTTIEAINSQFTFAIVEHIFADCRLVQRAYSVAVVDRKPMGQHRPNCNQ
jgi:hypothetical protein